MSFKVDIEKIKEDIKTVLQSDLLEMISEVNCEHTDFAIVEPLAANYHMSLKEFVPQYPAIMIVGREVEPEYYSGSARAATYFIDVGFIHDGSDAGGTEEAATKYCERMARAIDQVILAENMTHDFFGSDYIEYVYCEGWTFNQGDFPGDSMTIQNVVLSLKVQEATEDLP